jgi:hypothetical protein
VNPVPSAIINHDAHAPWFFVAQKQKGAIMEKDDYFVVVYKILAYLYVILKEGRHPDPKLLQHDSKMLGINELYWTYIMESLQDEGHIKGLDVTTMWGGDKMISGLESCQITPAGIWYLMDDYTMEKVKDFLMKADIAVSRV